MKKVLIYTTNRADYSKLEPIVSCIHNSKNYSLYLVIGGSHLLNDYGNTENYIKYPIYKKLNTLIYGDNSRVISESVSFAMNKFPQILDDIKPDCVIIHGDRFDILSLVIPAVLMKICIIHIEGGDMSGCLDNHIRHGVSKFSHYHFVSNNFAKKNLLKMGEKNIYSIGCPSLDKIKSIINNDLLQKNNIEYLEKIWNYSLKNFILFTYHPDTLDNKENNIGNYKIILKCLENTAKDINIICFYPNIDEHSKFLVKELLKYRNNKRFLLLKSLNFDKFITLTNKSKLIIGNSSSIVIECPFIGKPTILLGNRQKNRILSKSTLHLKNYNEDILTKAINIKFNRKEEKDFLYGDGNFKEKFEKIFTSLNLSFNKTFI